MINYFIVTGLLMVATLAIFIWRGYRQKQKANVIITKQKQEVEEQKHLIEEKQKEILDSIQYARRIQRSLLTSEKYIARHLSKLLKF
jgi:type VI protein secretion system component VasK